MKIAIVGNIGIGKSTVIQGISQQLRIPIFLEPVQEWKEWLDLFYADPKRWGMSFNMNVIMSFAQWKNNSFKAIYERSPMCCKNVFTELQYMEGSMTSMEYDLFQKVYEQVAWEPDVIIYIRADPSVCADRIKRRGRECEHNVSVDYIQKVHDLYERMIVQCKQKVYIVNGEQPQDHVLADVLGIIRSI